MGLPTIVHFTVAPRIKVGKYAGYHAHLIEYGGPVVRGGTLPKWKKKAKNPNNTGKGVVVGYRPAQPFMRPAYENKGEEAIDVFKKKLSERIDKAIEDSKE